MTPRWEARVIAGSCGCAAGASRSRAQRCACQAFRTARSMSRIGPRAEGLRPEHPGALQGGATEHPLCCPTEMANPPKGGDAKARAFTREAGMAAGLPK